MAPLSLSRWTWKGRFFLGMPVSLYFPCCFEELSLFLSFLGDSLLGVRFLKARVLAQLGKTRTLLCGEVLIQLGLWILFEINEKDL